MKSGLGGGSAGQVKRLGMVGIKREYIVIKPSRSDKIATAMQSGSLLQDF